jgi:hypothetical protein
MSFQGFFQICDMLQMKGETYLVGWSTSTFDRQFHEANSEKCTSWWTLLVGAVGPKKNVGHKEVLTGQFAWT